jgi:hypothetical protein
MSPPGTWSSSRSSAPRSAGGVARLLVVRRFSGADAIAQPAVLTVSDGGAIGRRPCHARLCEI